MNKKELLDNLRSVYEAVPSEAKLERPETKFNGAKWYSVEVMAVYGIAASFVNLQFYVVNEGTETEAAYFKKDQVPAQFVTDITEKVAQVEAAKLEL